METEIKLNPLQHIAKANVAPKGSLFRDRCPKHICTGRGPISLTSEHIIYDVRKGVPNHHSKGYDPCPKLKIQEADTDTVALEDSQTLVPFSYCSSCSSSSPNPSCTNTPSRCIRARHHEFTSCIKRGISGHSPKYPFSLAPMRNLLVSSRTFNIAWLDLVLFILFFFQPFTALRTTHQHDDKHTKDKGNACHAQSLHSCCRHRQPHEQCGYSMQLEDETEHL